MILKLQKIIKKDRNSGFWIVSFISFISSPFITNDGLCLLLVTPVLDAFSLSDENGNLKNEMINNICDEEKNCENENEKKIENEKENETEMENFCQSSGMKFIENNENGKSIENFEIQNNHNSNFDDTEKTEMMIEKKEILDTKILENEFFRERNDSKKEHEIIENEKFENYENNGDDNNNNNNNDNNNNNNNNNNENNNNNNNNNNSSNNNNININEMNIEKFEIEEDTSNDRLYFMLTIACSSNIGKLHLLLVNCIYYW